MEVEVAKDVLLGLVRRMGLEPRIDGTLREGIIWLEVAGDEEGILIGRHGRTLEALEILVSRMVNRRLEQPMRIVIDVDRYRERRADSLSKLADRLGEKAKREARAITIGPFNPQERRIIHMALQNDPYVETQSIGEGPVKKISILPRKR